MKLFYKPGVCSQATHIILNELGLDFQIERVDRETGLTASGAVFTTISPNGYVPALELAGGQVLTEGPAILQYLADQHPGSGLAPAPGTLERAAVVATLSFVSSELHASFRPFFRNSDLAGEARQAAEERLGKQFAYLESLLSDGRQHVTGEAFTIADAYAFVVSTWAPMVEFDLSPWPKVQAFVERVHARPSVKQARSAEGLDT